MCCTGRRGRGRSAGWVSASSLTAGGGLQLTMYQISPPAWVSLWPARSSPIHVWCAEQMCMCGGNVVKSIQGTSGQILVENIYKFDFKYVRTPLWSEVNMMVPLYAELTKTESSNGMPTVSVFYQINSRDFRVISHCTHETFNLSKHCSFRVEPSPMPLVLWWHRRHFSCFTQSNKPSGVIFLLSFKKLLATLGQQKQVNADKLSQMCLQTVN